MIGVLYRPPGGSTLKFGQELAETVNVIKDTSNCDVFVMGEYNINYNDKLSDSFGHMAQFEMDTGLKQLIDSPTRQGNILDLVYTNSDFVAAQGVQDLILSDHSLIYVTRKKFKVKHASKIFLGRSYKNYDKEVFQEQLSRKDWTEMYSAKSTQEAWDFMLNQITSVIDDMCPIKRMRIREGNEPWLTNELREMILDKNRAWRSAKKSGSDEDWVKAKRLRNDIKTLLRRARADFIQSELERHSDNPKKFWETINTILPNKAKTTSLSLTDKNKKCPVRDEDTADFINTYFAAIGNNLAAKFVNNSITSNTVPTPILARNNMESLIANEMDVLSAVKEINISKSSAIDKLSSRVMKDAFMVLIGELTYIINLSFTSETFPDSWKVSNIIPLQKPGDKTDVNIFTTYCWETGRENCA